MMRNILEIPTVVRGEDAQPIVSKVGFSVMDSPVPAPVAMFTSMGVETEPVRWEGLDTELVRAESGGRCSTSSPRVSPESPLTLMLRGAAKMPDAEFFAEATEDYYSDDSEFYSDEEEEEEEEGRTYASYYGQAQLHGTERDCSAATALDYSGAGFRDNEGTNVGQGDVMGRHGAGDSGNKPMSISPSTPLPLESSLSERLQAGGTPEIASGVYCSSWWETVRPVASGREAGKPSPVDNNNLRQSSVQSWLDEPDEIEEVADEEVGRGDMLLGARVWAPTAVALAASCAAITVVLSRRQ